MKNYVSSAASVFSVAAVTLAFVRQIVARELVTSDEEKKRVSRSALGWKTILRNELKY
jgi:hypothetical protein